MPNWWTDLAKEIFTSLNNNIIISPSDKSGGGMNSSVYKQKLMDLHDNNNTYEQISPQTISRNVNDF